MWNIGNFSDVNYTINETDSGNYIIIKALDAVKFYPLLSIDHSSNEDYNYSFGYGDDNFIGSNTRLNLQWNKQPTGVSYSFNFGIPRQLLYKNMTLGFGMVVGNQVKRNINKVIAYNAQQEIDSVSYVPTMLSPIKKFEVYASIGNPWHLDDSYRFSPNLSIGYAYHETNLSLLTPEELAFGVELLPYKHSLLSIGVSESVGIINRKRHRADGYLIGASYGITIGLNSESPTYHSFGLSAQYHKIYNSIVQFSTWIRTGYTTANIPYQYSRGSSDVLGIRSGEIYGNSYYSAYAGVHLTWLNKNWLAIENSYFANWGAGTDNYFNLFIKRPNMALGTSFRFTMPIFSALSMKLTFMYAGPGSEWFKFNF